MLVQFGFMAEQKKSNENYQKWKEILLMDISDRNKRSNSYYHEDSRSGLC
jgi:hypothetical protein